LWWDKLNTNYSSIEKIIIAPQIVVYKNIFKHSKEIIDLLQESRDTSFFNNWRDWYKQGFRRDADPDLLKTINTSDNQNLILEKQYIEEINDCMKFIRKDYLNEFEKENGIWPSFIKSWENLKEEDRNYWIDFFRYDHKVQSTIKASGLTMDYHVDEIPVPGEKKLYRHVATVNFYLNNEYDGGQICVYDSISNNTYMYKPMPGDAVIMPSTEPFYHGVKPFAKSDRYFLRAFIDAEVHNEVEWISKYEVIAGKDSLSNVTTEEDYVKKDLQIIQIKSDSNLIEVK
jgi:hypothetical protein